MITPALYDAEVTHRRHVDVPEQFRHRLRTWLVDLDEIPKAPWPLRPLARFDARDHLGSPDRTIRQNVESFLAGEGIDLGGGRIVMLAGARVFGHAFNPLSVYWCHDQDGALVCMVAEVHNTYGERHCYLLRPDQAGVATADKRFYVSPFLPAHGRYLMSFEEPGDRLRLRVQLTAGPAPLLSAELSGHRIAGSWRGLLLRSMRRPFTPQRVSLLIRWHGVGLWLRGLRPAPRPKARRAE